MFSGHFLPARINNISEILFQSAVAEVNGDASLTKGHSTEPALLFPQEEKECIILPGVTKMESTTDGKVVINIWIKGSCVDISESIK